VYRRREERRDYREVGLVLMYRSILAISRVGQNHIYTVYIRYFWQGDHQIYGIVQCICLVLANPSYNECARLRSMLLAGLTGGCALRKTLAVVF
jgi:hypothetical protein